MTRFDALPLFSRKGWRRLSFGEFAQSVNERVEPSEAAEEIYVGLDDIDPGDLHIRRWGKGSDVIGTKLRFRKGEIIFGRRRAYQRKLAVADNDGICSAHAMVVRAKPDAVLPEFLPFLMISDRFMKRAVDISVGSLSPTINWTTLKLEEFDLPPLDQQRRVADLLWRVDGAVQHASAALVAARAVVSATLADFLYATPGWQERDCGEVLEGGPRNGYSPPAISVGTGLPTLSIGAVRNGEVIIDGNVKFANVESEDVAQFQLRLGDVLVVRGNGNRFLCGKAGLVREYPAGCFYPDLLIRLRFRSDALLQEFAALQWNEPKTYARLISKAKSTNGIWKINGKDIRSHRIFVPPIVAQKQFLDDLHPRQGLMQDLDRHLAGLGNLQRELINTIVSE